jgi:hypothetical protein
MSEDRKREDEIRANIIKDGATWRGDVDCLLRIIDATRGTLSEETAVQEVVAERRRQVEAEGWTAEHDDQHGRGELLAAAICYLHRRREQDMFGRYETSAPAAWPWTLNWWKPTNRRRDLVKAGALILAEIERIDRAASRSKTAPAPSDAQASMFKVSEALRIDDEAAP